MRKLPAIASVLFVIVALVLGVAALPIGAADHLDGPMVMTDSQLDITDLYVFQSPAKASNTVLIMDVQPLAGVQNPTTFSSTGTYEFKIDSHGGTSADITYTVTFSAPDASGRQLATVKSGNATLGSGMTGSPIALSNGGTAITGLYDDPFFFDLAAFKNNLQFCPGGQGTNFFKGLNVNAIVLEVPSSALGGKISIWARTAKNGKQFDRMGRPAINTVFSHTDSQKDAFNSTDPVDDQKNYTAQVVATLKALGNDDATANKLAGVLLPDVLTFDTSSSQGFLNGRKLDDDVIDAELSLITGGKVTTDCVANDSAFRATFPYLAVANGMPGLPSTGGGGAVVVKAQRTTSLWAIVAMIACLAGAVVTGTLALRGRKR